VVVGVVVEHEEVDLVEQVGHVAVAHVCELVLYLLKLELLLVFEFDLEDLVFQVQHGDVEHGPLQLVERHEDRLLALCLRALQFVEILLDVLRVADMRHQVVELLVLFLPLVVIISIFIFCICIVQQVDVILVQKAIHVHVCALARFRFVRFT